MIQIFGLLCIGIPISVIVYSVDMVVLYIGLVGKKKFFLNKIQVAFFLLIISIFLKFLAKKRKFTLKEYREKLKEITEFYNSNGLSGLKTRVGFGSKGAYISFIQFKEQTILAPRQEFYQTTGVGYNPYQNEYAVEEIIEQPPKKNWRELRKEEKQKNNALGGDYVWAEEHTPGNIHSQESRTQSGPGYQIF